MAIYGYYLLWLICCVFWAPPTHTLISILYGSSPSIEAEEFDDPELGPVEVFTITWTDLRNWHARELTTECAICLNAFSNRDLIRFLACGHHFHGDCLTKWFQEQHSCPICRYVL